jgi:hypothetical protein
VTLAIDGAWSIDIIELSIGSANRGRSAQAENLDFFRDIRPAGGQPFPLPPD